MPPGDEFKIAGHGQKTIKVQINFWTDNIAPKGYIKPKHCWPSGMVTVPANPAHGIRSQDPIPFNKFEDLPDAIQQALEEAGVTAYRPGDR